MAAPYFLVTNKLRSAAILAEATAASFPFANALDGRTSTQAGFSSGAARNVDFDFGSAQTITHIGYAAHSLTGSTVAIYSSTNGSSWTLRLSSIALAGVQTYEFGTSFSARYFRLSVTPASGTVYVSDFFAGQAIELPYGIPHGFVPPEQGDQDAIETNMTGNGALVGITVTRKPKRTRVSLNDYPASWFDSNWSALIETMKLYPAYFLWATGKRAFYCTLARTAPSPAYNSNIRQSATLELEGFVE
jgi:hypothetical protein